MWVELHGQGDTSDMAETIVGSAYLCMFKHFSIYFLSSTVLGFNFITVDDVGIILFHETNT